MSEHIGKSIRIYLAEGTPQGILTAEIVNWTGHVLTAPQSKLAGLLGRPESSRAGVYFLMGPDPEGSGQTLVYIGQSENVGKRLKQHNKDDRKAFWEKSCIVTSKDQNLTSGHIKYLESRLIVISAKSGLVNLTNDTSPEASNLPEADIADMEYFISQLRLILPVLGLEFLREVSTIAKAQLNATLQNFHAELRSPIFEINSQKHKLVATAQEIDGEFIVQAGSQCRSSWEGVNTHSSYSNLRRNLFEQGKIGADHNGVSAVFKEDVIFSSPSAAAAIVYGRASNGRTAWKIKGENKTYEDWQNSLLPDDVVGAE